MKISGFTMVRNATLLYYPIRQVIESILPLVNEFVVALGEGDPDDRTEEEILSIGSPKIRILKTVWDIKNWPNGMENARQTDLAKAQCRGDWLFYLQADEVVHEKHLPVIRNYCEQYLNLPEVEGFLFHYLHFWGDFHHYQISHGWYKHEIRIIRNLPDIHSWESAQSFRFIPGFDGKNYRQRKNTRKLRVVAIPAFIYHYGWVRPPRLMQSKKRSLDTIHKGQEKADALYTGYRAEFDYGPLGSLPVFTDSHPAVMKDWIARFDWADQLNYSKNHTGNQPVRHKHLLFRNRLLTFIEQHFLKGREIGGFKNYELIKPRRTV